MLEIHVKMTFLLISYQVWNSCNSKFVLPAYNCGNVYNDDICITCILWRKCKNSKDNIITWRKSKKRRPFFYLPIIAEINVQTTFCITCLSWRKCMKRQHFYLSIMAEIYVKTTLLPAYHGGNLCKDDIITCLSLIFMLRRHYYYLPCLSWRKLN